MPGGQVAVARATAAVFVDGRRTGSAVLVTGRYLVTAAHVLTRQDAETSTRVAVDRVELEFPVSGPSAPDGRLSASRLDLGAVGAGADVAVLDLGDDPSVGLPVPVPVWPAAQPPEQVRVFGYPLEERALNGVWRRFEVAGPAAGGLVQLDWIGDVGTFRGHSGGPVIDADEGSLAGILLQGSEQGRFDRYLPVAVIAEVWPKLPKPWLVAGGVHGEARGHFSERSRGQRNKGRGGDLFRGRQKALERVTGWLTAPEPPSLPLVITGQPGAGKSTVLARAALSIEAEYGGPGLAFHARAATLRQLLDALAALTGVDTPVTAGELIESLETLPGGPLIAVAVDALDEVASDEDRRQIIDVLTGLTALPMLRVVVATRPLAPGNRYVQGGLLATLGVTGHEAANLLDLDGGTYFDPVDLSQFAAALLAQEGTDRPGPSGAAWSSYRDLPAVRDRLAVVITERARRNFLVAAMAAVPLSIATQVTDPAEHGFDPASIPSGVGEALSKYLDQLPDQRCARDRALLTALAYARGAGLDDPAWLAFAAALGYQATVADLDVLRRSAAADYLLQTTTAERGARPVTRLFHQALADELLDVRHRPSDESLLLDMLLEQVRQTGWQDRYARDHAAEHASVAGRIDELLDDALYLITVDPARLVPYLDTERSSPARAAAVVYRQTAHLLTTLDEPMRASQLELSARRLGCRALATRIAAAAPYRPWRTRWSRGLEAEAADHQVLTGHDGFVNAVVVGVLADGTAVVVSGGDDGTVRVWRLSDGSVVWKLADLHGGSVPAIAVGALVDGTAVVVSGGDDATVRVWRLSDGAPVGDPLRGHDGWVSAVTVGALADGTPVIVSGGWDDETVRVWRMRTGKRVGEPLRGHDGAVFALAAGLLVDGTPVFVSGGDDGTVRVWRLSDGAPVGDPMRGHDHDVEAVAVGALADGTPVIVSGGQDGTVRVWRLSDGAPVGDPMRGHDGPVSAVAVNALTDGTSVVVSSGWDYTVRVWRLGDGSPVGEPMRGHDGEVSAVAVGALADGTGVAVSGGDDGTVRVWRLSDGVPVGEPMRGRGRGRAVSVVAVGALADGTGVAVSGGDDRTVRVWRLGDGTPVGEALIVSDILADAVAVRVLTEGSAVVVTGGTIAEMTAGVWRLADGTWVKGPLRLGRNGISAVAAGVLTNGTVVVVGFIKEDRFRGTDGNGTLMAWRLSDGAPMGEPMRGHDGDVSAVAVGPLADGTPVVVSGGRYDRTVRVWKLDDQILLVPPLELSQKVVGVDLNGNVVVTAAGTDVAVHQLVPD